MGDLSPDQRALIARQGLRGFALDQAVLSLQRPRLAARRSQCAPEPASPSNSTVAIRTGASLANRDVISMPDKWEYPWYAAWDLAFHMVPFAEIDIDFAKRQLILFLREWYMHPSGQIPAYEFAFGDTNPPVHAWAALRIYQYEKKQGNPDRAFLARVFHKLVD